MRARCRGSTLLRSAGASQGSTLLRRASTKAGFTLVEVMLVVMIIGVLAAMVVPRLPGRARQAKIARATADLAAIGVALDLYELDVGRYPESLEALVDREPPPEVDPAQWNGPYLRGGVPNDPWGRPYVYSRVSQHHQDYDLMSFGPDGQPGNDDVANWR
ncbi:MAG TPA: type II secretion system major pseudopilin GspG [bacterium]